MSTLIEAGKNFLIGELEGWSPCKGSKDLGAEEVVQLAIEGDYASIVAKQGVSSTLVTVFPGRRVLEIQTFGRVSKVEKLAGKPRVLEYELKGKDAQLRLIPLYEDESGLALVITNLAS